MVTVIRTGWNRLLLLLTLCLLPVMNASADPPAPIYRLPTIPESRAAYRVCARPHAAGKIATVERLPQTGPQPVTLEDVRRIALGNNKDIQVVRHRQEVRLAEIDRLLGDFETVLGAGLYGGHTDRQVRNIIESFGTSATEQESYFLRPIADDQFFMEQKLYSGGRVRLGLVSDFLQVDPSDTSTFVNPGWDSAIRLRFEQPLFRGRGRAVNTAPIEIARARAEQSIHDFQTAVNTTLSAAEKAYWALEFSQRTAELLREVTTRTETMLEREKGRLDLGRGSIPAVARTEERHSRARAEYVRALGRTRLAELRLRLLLGLPPVPEEPIITTTSSDETLQELDWNVGLARARQRPEILAQTAAIDAARRDVCLRQNGLKPDVRVALDYAVTGLEGHFDDSIDTLVGHSYNDWRVGLVYQRPLNQITQNAMVWQSSILLHRELAQLERISHKILNEVFSAHSALDTTRSEIDIQRQRVTAADEDRKARRDLYEKGRETLDQVFDAEDRYLEAALDERTACRNFQQAWVDWRFATGAIMDEYVIVD